jgi:hypothetical protein
LDIERSSAALGAWRVVAIREILRNSCSPASERRLVRGHRMQLSGARFAFAATARAARARCASVLGASVLCTSVLSAQLLGCPQPHGDATPAAVGSERPVPPWAAPRKENLEPPTSIGSAKLLPDGTLELTLRATDGKGRVGDALLRLAPGDKDYDMWLQHLGRMKPGEEKIIAPFLDTL